MVHDMYDRDSFRVVCFRIFSRLSVKPYIVLDQQRDDSELFAHAFQNRPLLSFVMLPFQHVHYNYACMYALLPPQDERLGLVRHGWLSTTSIVPCWWLFGFFSHDMQVFVVHGFTLESSFMTRRRANEKSLRCFLGVQDHLEKERKHGENEKNAKKLSDVSVSFADSSLTFI